MVNNTGLKTILILAANPTNTSRLRLDEEIREIDEGLRRANRREQFKLEQKWAVRSRDFYRAILDYQPQIVHFCGHGAGQDGIILEDDTGKMVLLETRTLASMFKLFAKKSVECVILNACYSEVQATAISQYVNYVLGMKQAIGDKAALAFSVAFYDALAAGYEVEEAYELGCSQMMGFLEQETPVLKRKPLSPAPIYTDIPIFEEVIPPNPYQGLAAFEEEDADFFFGQENFVNQLVEVTNKQPLVGVIGPSGSGKSSVVFAGLIPKLRKEENWLIEIFRPGKNPFFPLAFALVRQLEPEAGETHKMREAMELASDFQQGRIKVKQVIDQILEWNPGKKLLLVADQFEELYTLCPVEEEQERFNNELLTAITSENVTLVFTLRADFYGYVLSHRPFRDALEQYTPQLLSSMKREELQQAIELPAQKLEVQLEGKLTQRILDDVGQEPGNLPLLEFALTQLWEKQKNRTLTHAAYEEIGGIKKAIIKTAEQIYNQLSLQEQEQVRNIFVRLTRLDDRSVRSEQHRDTRRRVAMQELVPLDSNTGVIKDLVRRLADERLVVTSVDEVTGREEVEVVHEALIQYWSRLQEWLNQDRENLQLRERIRQQALDWQLQTKDELLLLQGGRLEDAIALTKHQPTFFNQLEDSYIKGCLKLRERKHRQEVNRLRQWVGALSAALLVAVGSGGIAFINYQEANKQTILANLGLDARKAKDLLNSDPVDALVLAIKATGQSYQTFEKVLPEVQASLYQAIDVPVESRIFPGNGQPVNSIAVSPDGKVIASGRQDGTIELWDYLNNRPLIPPFKNNTSGVWIITFSPNGKMLAIGNEDGKIEFFDLQKRSIIRQFKAQNSPVYSLAFNKDGTKIASGTKNGKIWIFDLEGKPINPPLSHKSAVLSVDYCPNSEKLISGSEDKNLVLWNLEKKDNRQIFYISTNQIINSIDFNPNCNLIISGNQEGIIQLWNLKYQPLREFIHSPGKPVYSVAFNRDGSKIVTGSHDNTIRVWNTEDKLLTQPLRGHQDRVLSVAFRPNSETIVSGSEDGTVRLWQLGETNLIREQSYQHSITSVALSPDGETLVTGNKDGKLYLWNNKKGKLKVPPLDAHRDNITSIAFTSDSKMFVTGSYDKTLRLWRTGGQLIGKPFQGHDDSVSSVAFSSNNQIIASGSWDKKVRLWNLEGKLIVPPLQGHKDVILTVAFSPKQQVLASGSYDGTVILWDIKGNKLKSFIANKSGVSSLAFNFDGQTIVTGHRDGTLRLWNLESQQISDDSKFQGHQERVNSVAFSNQSQTEQIIVSSSQDKTVRLWNREGDQIGENIHPTDLLDASISSDGKEISSISKDGNLRVWRGGNWIMWLEIACNKIRYHFILQSPENKNSFSAYQTCQKFMGRRIK